MGTFMRLVYLTCPSDKLPIAIRPAATATQERPHVAEDSHGSREQRCSRPSNTVLARATLFSLEQHCSCSSNTALARATLLSPEQHCSRSSNVAAARASDRIRTKRSGNCAPTRLFKERLSNI